MKTMKNGAALSRRTLLAGSAVVAAGAPALDAFGAGVALMEAAGLAAQNLHPDAKLLLLTLQTLDSWAESDRLNGIYGDRRERLGEDHPDVDAAWDAVLAEHKRGSDLDAAARLIAARTIDGVFAKLVVKQLERRDRPLTPDTCHGDSALADALALAVQGKHELTMRIVMHPVLAGIFGAEVLAAAGPMPSAHPDAELLTAVLTCLDGRAEVLRAFDELDALCDRLKAETYGSHPKLTAADRRVQRLDRRNCAVRQEIFDTAARTADGVFAKAVLAAEWEWVGETVESAGAASVLRDLHHMAAPGAGELVKRILAHPITVNVLAEAFGEDAPAAVAA